MTSLTGGFILTAPCLAMD